MSGAVERVSKQGDKNWITQFAGNTLQLCSDGILY